MLLQGIAWIDQSDFRIVRLRTDLLAPQPEIQVQRQTASILFGPGRDCAELVRTRACRAPATTLLANRGDSFNAAREHINAFPVLRKPNGAT